MTQTSLSIPPRVRFLMRMERVFRRWLPIFLALFALFNLLPLLAPIAMNAGATGAGNAIYDLYGTISHQFANRSYFLFGEQIMYAADELPIAFTGDVFQDERALKQYRGDEQRGWKVAWSDRLVAMFASWWLSALIYGLLSRRQPPQPIPLWLAVLLIAPLVIDGLTHSVSDTASLFEGFRYTNEWLAARLGATFPPEFYRGHGLGSLNWWLRLITGVSFGIGLVGYTYPRVDAYFHHNADVLAAKLQQWRNRRKGILTND